MDEFVTGSLCARCEGAPATLACQQCSELYCTTCSETVHQGQMRHHRVAAADAELPRLCPVHASIQLDFYCCECSEIVCPECLLVGAHEGHTCEPLPVAYANAIEHMKQKAEEIAEQRRALEERQEELRPFIPQVETDHEELIADIEKRAHELLEMIDAREVALSQDIAELEKTRRATIENQVQETRKEIERMNEVIDEVQDALAVADHEPEKFLDEFDPMRLQSLMADILSNEADLQPRVPAEFDILLDINVYKSVILDLKLEPLEDDEAKPGGRHLIPAILGSLLHGTQHAVTNVTHKVAGLTVATAERAGALIIRGDREGMIVASGSPTP